VPTLKKYFYYNTGLILTKSRAPNHNNYTLSEAWSGVNWAGLMAAQGAFGTDFYDRSTRTIGTMFWTEYRPVIKMGPKGALGSHKIRPIHSAPSLGQSIEVLWTVHLASLSTPHKNNISDFPLIFPFPPYLLHYQGTAYDKI